jgi:hypothetical protein
MMMMKKPKDKPAQIKNNMIKAKQSLTKQQISIINQNWF